VEFRERAVRTVFEHTGDHASQWAANHLVGSASGFGAPPLSSALWLQ
jgi:hypothetical protein